MDHSTSSSVQKRLAGLAVCLGAGLAAHLVAATLLSVKFSELLSMAIEVVTAPLPSENIFVFCVLLVPAILVAAGTVGLGSLTGVLVMGLGLRAVGERCLWLTVAVWMTLTIAAWGPLGGHDASVWPSVLHAGVARALVVAFDEWRLWNLRRLSRPILSHG